MNDMELTEEIASGKLHLRSETGVGRFLSGEENQQIIAALRRGPEREVCPRCKGSGEAKGMTYGHGPDDYEIDTPCPDCNGTGERPPSGDMVMVLKSFAENRCYACGWPLAGSATNGCTPFNCSYRPSEQSAGHSYWLKKAHEMERVRAMLSAAEAEGRKS